jgi:FixJ family two-component response regulator/anti-sigma regulatory factor (Ser/Thr protein kinase)
MKSPHKVLLIDDEAIVRDELGGLLTDEGYRLITAADGEEGIAHFRGETPDMVITDVRMPRRDGLSVALTIRKEAPMTPVTVITGHGSEKMVLEALRAGVTDFLRKPVSFEDLSTALERMEAALRLTRTQLAELPPSVAVQERTWVYRLSNDLAAIPLFVDVLLRRAAAVGDPRTTGELSLALRELLMNAIEHGNLEISYEQKSRALQTGTLARIVKKRCEQPELASRTTTVWVVRRADTLSIRIRDGGAGFDWRRLPDPTAGANLLADHGRGVLLARMSVDELTYNHAGNEVTLRKVL